MQETTILSQVANKVVQSMLDVNKNTDSLESKIFQNYKTIFYEDNENSGVGEKALYELNSKYYELKKDIKINGTKIDILEQFGYIREYKYFKGMNFLRQEIINEETTRIQEDIKLHTRINELHEFPIDHFRLGDAGVVAGYSGSQRRFGFALGTMYFETYENGALDSRRILEFADNDTTSVSFLPEYYSSLSIHTSLDIEGTYESGKDGFVVQKGSVRFRGVNNVDDNTLIVEQGNTLLNGSCNTTGDSVIGGSIEIGSTCDIGSDCDIGGNNTISGNCDIDGNVTVGGNTNIQGTLTQNDTAMFYKEVSFYEAVEHTKDINMNNNDIVNGGTFYGVATAAQYADLAENYLADNPDLDYLPYGTVTAIQDDEFEDAEIKIFQNDCDVLCGVVSENPAYLMNAKNKYLQKMYRPIVLKGRTPVRTKTKIKKGMIVYASINYPGTCEGIFKKDLRNSKYSSNILSRRIGIALSNDHDGFVEVKI